MADTVKNSEIFIFGRIGSAVTAYGIAEQLKMANNEEVTIKISSYGGDLAEGHAIYNLLRDYQGRVICEIIGVCASAATIIAMAGNSIKMKSNAVFMIHEPSITLFDVMQKNDLSKIIDELEKLNESIVEVYASRTKLDKNEIRSMLKAEKWLNAEESRAKGFIDEIIPIAENQVSTPSIQVLDSFKQKVLMEERKRIIDLDKAKTSNIAICAIIDQAKSDGKTLMEIQPYIDAIKKTPETNNPLEKIFKDYSESGATEISGISPKIDDKQSAIDEIVRYSKEWR